MSQRRILQVALPVPLPQLFDYRWPEGVETVEPGCRIRVPFGRRRLVGIVAGIADRSELPESRLVRALDCPDSGASLLDERLLELLRWCSRYYKHPPGDVLLSALPPALRALKGRLPPEPTHYALTQAGRDRLTEPPGRAPVQFRMLQALAEGPCGESALAGIGSQWRKTLAALLDSDWVEPVAAAEPEPNPSSGPVLTDDQQSVVDAITAGLDRFQCHLLDGVTGSGKTEVYMCLLEQALAAGRQALVLVPEIGLTPQLLRRFRQRLGLEPAVIHSGLAAGARLEAWNAARTGRAPLLIGTRSALFTPMPRLGLMVLDEEHDASFKQQDGFRYSARDVAVKRASDLGIPIVLGSATPSLESLRNALEGRYRWHRLRHRATRIEMPSWRVLDLRQQPTRNGLSQAALEAIGETLERDEQVMVFLNRRGYAPVLMCQSCGWYGDCERCDAHLTWHRSAGRLWCHHCGSQRRVPAHCPECRADALTGAGEGTQQLEETLGQLFPGIPVLRFDRDRVSRKGIMEQQIDQVRGGEPCLLVGTQMLAKGHHFPGVTLVVIVSVDQALYSADFRAMERMGQLIQQVAGRAGRSDKPGTVILQTLHPEHSGLDLLLSQGYEAFARWQLEERIQAGLPPAGYQALLRAEAHDRQQVERFLRDAADVFPAGATRIHGPMPAIMERLGGRSRMYLMLLAKNREALHAQIDPWLPGLRSLESARRVRWSVDIDPLEL